VELDRDAADVTLDGRSFQTRGPTIGKARLATVDSHTASARRSKRSTPFRRPAVDTEVLCRESVQDFVCQNSNQNWLRHTQPVESDVVGSAEMKMIRHNVR